MQAFRTLLSMPGRVYHHYYPPKQDKAVASNTSPVSVLRQSADSMQNDGKRAQATRVHEAADQALPTDSPRPRPLTLSSPQFFHFKPKEEDALADDMSELSLERQSSLNISSDSFELRGTQLKFEEPSLRSTQAFHFLYRELDVDQNK